PHLERSAGVDVPGEHDHLALWVTALPRTEQPEDDVALLPEGSGIPAVADVGALAAGDPLQDRDDRRGEVDERHRGDDEQGAYLVLGGGCEEGASVLDLTFAERDAVVPRAHPAQVQRPEGDVAVAESAVIRRTALEVRARLERPLILPVGVGGGLQHQTVAVRLDEPRTPRVG